MSETSIQASETSQVEREETPVVVQKSNQSAELKAFNQIVSAVESFDEEARVRIFHSVLTFLGMANQPLKVSSAVAGTTPPSPSSFSDNRTLSVKQFLFEKKPLTDVERVACLAYYLTHYRETPHFKTLDISKLNTEAAQTKFANAAAAVGNAIQSGLIAPAGGENRQISAVGERYVQELPDRIAAKETVVGVRQRRRSKRTDVKNEPH